MVYAPPVSHGGSEDNINIKWLTRSPLIIAKQRRGLFYEEIQHAFDFHAGLYSSTSMANKPLHAITARQLVKNPLLPTTTQQNARLLELADKWQ